MRIIAGEHRGRKLLGPVDKATTRPITDRVKQALFDRLAAAGRLEGAVVLDVFSGTGSMGLECLSRGAEHVTFIERDRVAKERLLKNLSAIGQTDDGRIMSADALAAGLVGALSRKPYTLVFMDPPYKMMTDGKSRAQVMAQVSRLAEGAADGALLMLRVEKHVAVGAVDGWTGPEAHPYGSMVLCFYEKA